MRFPMLGGMFWRAVAVTLVLCRFICSAAAHNVPSQLPDPLSSAEAWNVIEGSASNIDKLLDENLLRDITFQIANTDSSLRYLGAHSDQPAIASLTVQMLADGSNLIGAIREAKQTVENIKSEWQAYRKRLAELETFYQPELLHAAVYICPMHPLDRHLNAN